MKYKKKVKWLQVRQNWYDNQNDDYKKANTRPGSIKVR